MRFLLPRSYDFIGVTLFLYNFKVEMKILLSQVAHKTKSLDAPIRQETAATSVYCLMNSCACFGPINHVAGDVSNFRSR